MLGLLGMVPSGIKMALLAAVVVAAGGFYWHYTVVKGERDVALATVGAMEVVKEVQDATISSQRKAINEWAAHQANMQTTMKALGQTAVAAYQESRRLNNVLAKHNLTRLSLAKPRLIERRINSGTADIIRMLNAATAKRDHNDRGNSPTRGEKPGS